MLLQGCHDCFDVLQQVLTSTFAALKRNPDYEKPRTPPPRPTPLDFPCCEPKSTDSDHRTPHNVAKVFGGIQKLPTKNHLDALNLGVESDIPLEELVPAEHLPPISWLGAPDPTTDSISRDIPINGGSLPARDTFYSRAIELQIGNETGYRTIHRIPLRKNEDPIRLLFFRKFWEELDCVAGYWDTSQDQYTTSQSGSQNSSGEAFMHNDQPRIVPQQEGKLSEPELSRKETSEMQDVEPSQKNGSSSSTLPNEAQKPPTREDTPMPDVAPTDNSSARPPRPSTDSTLYTGHRTSTGSLMPLHHLEKVLFSFLNSLALPFRLRLMEPRSQPRLQLGPLLFPLPHMASIYRVPLDQERARLGWKEGPLMGAVATEYSIWRGIGERPGEGAKERVQLLKEVGCVLLLAQRRAMEGKEEVVPGLGKWWAEVPRWGGGSGVAVYKDPAGEKQTTGAAKGKSSLIDAQKRRIKRVRRGFEEQPKTNALVPPSSLWERYVRYARIGMEKGDGAGDTDDVSTPVDEVGTDQC